MKKQIVIIVLVSFVVLFSRLNGLPAEAAEWKFDTAHSRFNFEVDHIYAKVWGYFEDVSGTFVFDPDKPEEGRIDIRIQTDSINTNIRKRDNHLRSDDFFDVNKYPQITFVSKRITRKEGNQFLVEGDLTIKDVTKTLELPLTYFGTRDNPLKEGELVAGFETRFTLDRLEYHVGSGKYYEMGVAGKDIAVLVTLEMLRDK